MLPRTVRILGKIWLYGAGFVILFGYGSIWYQRGFGALQEVLSPYNFYNLIAVVITLAPAYFLQKLAGAIEEKHRGKALRSLAGIFLSVAAVVLMVTLVTVKNNEDKNTVGNDQTREYQASSIRVKGKSATMYQHKKSFVTLVSGPVGSEGIPETIQIGDVVTVKDNTIQVQYITFSSRKFWRT